MPKFLFILALICPVAVGCTPLSNLISPAPTAIPTATPTPTPAPDPCSADAMTKLGNEVRSLAHRYIEATKQEESWLPLLPDLMTLRRDVQQFLNLPRCTDRLMATLSNYTDLDTADVQQLIDGLAGGSLEDAVKAARYWLEEKVRFSSQAN